MQPTGQAKDRCPDRVEHYHGQPQFRCRCNRHRGGLYTPRPSPKYVAGIPAKSRGNGIDDDGNGFVDDVYRWDFANGDNILMDDNEHGTHVAGTIGTRWVVTVKGSRGSTGTSMIMALKFWTSPAADSRVTPLPRSITRIMMGVKVTNNSSWRAAPNVRGFRPSPGRRMQGRSSSSPRW